MSALKADPKGPSHYLRSKAEAERAIREGADERLAWTVFRPSVIFGPGDSFFNRFSGLLRILPVVPLARPNAQFAPVYAGDVAEAFARAAVRSSTRRRVFELCGPYVYSLREIVELTAQRLGKGRWIVGLPTSFIIDKTGRVVLKAVGGRLWDAPEFADAVERLIAED